MKTLTKEIKDFVTQTKLGFIATVCPDGTPNLSPKGTTIPWDNHHLIFADIHSQGTVNNLLTNPSIEINVVDVFTRKGYRFKGTATVHPEGTVFQEGIEMYRNRGSNHLIRNIVLMKVEQISPIISPAYDSGVSEEVVKTKWIDYWTSIHPKNK
jgi:predicted pyridoxine 5'-phosphate oxidase superfamily flavin-nucleotide-binding protein